MQNAKIVDEKFDPSLDDEPLNQFDGQAPAWLDRIERLEVSGCVQFEGEDGYRFIESAHAVEERAQFMTLYGRMPEGEALALGDFSNTAAAVRAGRRVKRMIKGGSEVTLAIMGRRGFEEASAR